MSNKYIQHPLTAEDSIVCIFGDKIHHECKVLGLKAYEFKNESKLIITIECTMLNKEDESTKIDLHPYQVAKDIDTLLEQLKEHSIETMNNSTDYIVPNFF